jgi:hypothetical protein
VSAGRTFTSLLAAWKKGEPLPWKATGQAVPREMEELELPVVTQRLKLKFRVNGKESAFMRSHAPGPFKITIPSRLHYLTGTWKLAHSQVFGGW